MGAIDLKYTPQVPVSSQFGKYTLLKQLAVGGMAEIWLAKQSGVQGFEKLVVIKRILGQLAGETEFLQMFLDEARLAASLTHPNIVQIYDLGNVDQSYFITMEFIAGQDLLAILKKARRAKMALPPVLAARMIASACEGLHYAHTRKDNRGNPLNIVHRDVSPSNILVTYEGAVKIVDFGIAKAESHTSKTRAGKLKGKFSYVSPEQIQGEVIDGRSDVFGLGIVLHEILTGRRLFKRNNELTILNDILTAEVLPPSSTRPEIPRELDEIVLRALEKDRKKRFASAQEMQLALEKFLAGRTEPSGSIHMAEYMMKLFAEEHAGYQRLLAELPTASPEELLSYLPGDKTGEGPSFEVSFNEGPFDTENTDSNPSVRPPRRISKHLKLAAMGLVGALAVLSATFMLLRSPPPPVLTHGDVSLESDPPGATIYVDGKKTEATTPATVSHLSLNAEHQIRLEHPGRQSRDLLVFLTHAMPSKAVAVTLLEEVKKDGSLQLVTDPVGARVFLDGKEQEGVTPMLLKDIPADAKHTLKLSLEGFRNEVLPLTVEAGKQLELRLSLKPKPGNVWGALRELTTRVEEKGPEAAPQRAPSPSKPPGAPAR